MTSYSDDDHDQPAHDGDPGQSDPVQSDPARSEPPRAMGRASVPTPGLSPLDDPGWSEPPPPVYPERLEADHFGEPPVGQAMPPTWLEGEHFGEPPVGQAMPPAWQEGDHFGQAPVFPARRQAEQVGEGPGGEEPKKRPRSKKARRRRMRRILAISIAVVVLLAGGSLIGVTYFYDKVPVPSELHLKNNTEIFAADGTTQLAKLGNENRVEIPMSKLSDPVKHALIAGEDKNFYEHHGVDMWGIARAAWNNLTGGETQGASTITQQYAREAASDKEITYARKLREAVMARKLEDDYSKEEIMGFYLNTIYFGRGAHGVGAAAQAFFGIRPDEIDKLTVAQAALLGAVIRQPEPEKGGHAGYDPQFNYEGSKGRWGYVLGNMVEKGWLSDAEKGQLEFPARPPAAEGQQPEPAKPGDVVKYDPKADSGAWGYTNPSQGSNLATGYVVEYVAQELKSRGILQSLGITDWKNAGLRVKTTINPIAQRDLEAQIRRDIPGSVMSKQKPNLMSAGVSIDPTSGRVIAYYGGTSNGSDVDWAGKNVTTKSGHPPASSFKIYTLAAALENGISTQSHWKSEAMQIKKGDDIDLANAGRPESTTCGNWCTLEEMTIASYNVPFYKIARIIGSGKVIDVAHRAGVQTIWNQDYKEYDLTKGNPVLDPYVGFGKYPITVLDHTTGAATFANHGVYHKPHFILGVEKKNKQTGQWERVPEGDEQLEVKANQVIRREVADEVTGVLKKVNAGHHPLKDGRQAAAKTGTWENGKPEFRGQSAHGWFLGYTTQIATVVWVGSVDENATPARDPNGNPIAGNSVPGEIWEKYMNAVHADLKLPKERITDGTGGNLGNPEKGDGLSPSPTPEATCPTAPLTCPTTGPSGAPSHTPGPTKTATPTPTPTKTTG